MTVKAFAKGDRVRFTGASLHTSSPEYYPAPGTIGIYQGGGWVQWPETSTTGDGRWHAPDSALAPAGIAPEKGAVRTFVLIVRPAACGREEAFIPHLEMHGEQVGRLGMATKFRDVLGRPLAVGDVVELFNRSNVSYGDNTVCCDGSPYVMGIKSSCDGASGSTGYWRLLKKRDHEQVGNGECIDGVRYVKNAEGAT